jgi:AcrR family transcriptional regulator
MPRGGSRADAFNRHREAVLDAALRLFTEHGVATTSIAQIRELSGTPTGSIYHHFGSKEGIAGELYVRCLIHFQTHLLLTVERAGSARELIETGVRQHLAWVEGNRERANFLTSSRDALSLEYVARIREINRPFFDELEELLAPWIDSREIRNLPLDLLEAIWLGPSQELTRHWLAGRVKTLDGAVDVLAEAAWRGLTTNKETS